MKLSVGLITFNEEKDLPRTLKAIKDIADEIVVVDSGSKDRTVEIAKFYGARIYSEEWKGFGDQKNSVIEKCKGKWILLIDADEEITPALKNEMNEIIHASEDKFKVYKLRFTTICFGKNIRHGGWSNFYRVRLFRNGFGKYDSGKVHEKFLTGEQIGMTKGYINHYTYENLEDYFGKFNEYTTELAKQYSERGKNKSILNMYFSSCFNFIKTYFLKLGFLDGYEGYLLSKLGAMYVLIKYSKLRELKRIPKIYDT